jgi:hypothetical protein
MTGEPLGRLLNMDHAGLEVHVLPAQSQELSLPQAGHDRQVHEGSEGRAIGGPQQAPHAIGVQGSYFLAPGAWRLHSVGGVARYQLPLKGML